MTYRELMQFLKDNPDFLDKQVIFCRIDRNEMLAKITAKTSVNYTVDTEGNLVLIEDQLDIPTVVVAFSKKIEWEQLNLL